MPLTCRGSRDFSDQRTLNRILHLQPGDLGRGAPFFLYYFLVIACYSMGQVARDALFLGRFAAVQLPYADIAIAVLVSLIVALYLPASPASYWRRPPGNALGN